MGGTGLMVPLPRHEMAIDGVLEHLLGGDGGRHVNHGQLDVLAVARLVPVLQGGQHGEGRVHPGQWVANAGNGRETVGVAGGPRQAGYLLHRRREPGTVPPRAVQAETGHAHHDDARVGGRQVLIGQSELFHDPRREVLHDDIRGGHQAEDEVPAAVIRQVEGDASLVQIGRLEDGPLLVPLVHGGVDPNAEAHGVRMPGRFDLDHVRAQGGQILGAHGPGQEGGEVDDPHTGQGKILMVRHRGALGDEGPGDTARGCRRLPRAHDALDSRRKRGRRSGWSPVGRSGQERGPGVWEPTPGIGVVELPARHVVESGEIRSVPDGYRRDPVQRSDLDHLVDGVPARPLLDGLDHIGPGPIALDVQRLVAGQVGALDHVEEGVPLGRGDGGHPDIAVETGLNARHHHVGGPDALSPGHARRNRRVADEGDGHALEGRHVDEVPVSGPTASAQCAERTERTERAHGPPGHAPAHGERFPVVAPVAVQRAGQGLEEQVRGFLPPTRPAQAESGEVHHDQSSVTPSQVAGIDRR